MGQSPSHFSGGSTCPLPHIGIPVPVDELLDPEPDALLDVGEPVDDVVVVATEDPLDADAPPALVSL